MFALLYLNLETFILAFTMDDMLNKTDAPPSLDAVLPSPLSKTAVIQKGQSDRYREAILSLQQSLVTGVDHLNEMRSQHISKLLVDLDAKDGKPQCE
jgi:hypothetical protein